MLLPGHTWLVISAMLGTWSGISADFYRQSISVLWPGWAGSAPSSSTASCCWRITAFVSTSFRCCGDCCCWLPLLFRMYEVRRSLHWGVGGEPLHHSWRCPFYGRPNCPQLRMSFSCSGRAAVVKFDVPPKRGALQMLTNRSNLSILAQSSAGLAASGVYSIAYYGLEAMWLVPPHWRRWCTPARQPNKPLGSAWSYTQDAWAGPSGHSCALGLCGADPRQLVRVGLWF